MAESYHSGYRALHTKIITIPVLPDSYSNETSYTISADCFVNLIGIFQSKNLWMAIDKTCSSKICFNKRKHLEILIQVLNVLADKNMVIHG